VTKSAFSKESSQHAKIKSWWANKKPGSIWSAIYSDSGGTTNSQMYGSFMVMCAPLEQLPNDTKEYAFAAKLTITSAIDKETTKIPSYITKYKSNITAAKKAGTTANEYGRGRTDGSFIFATDEAATVAKGKSSEALWGVETLNEEGKTTTGVHPSLANAAESGSTKTIQKALDDKTSAIVTKDLSTYLTNDAQTAKINDTITLNLGVQSYMNKDDTDGTDQYNITLKKYLKTYMKSGTKAKVKVTWTVYKKAPTYTASGTDDYGRTTYTAVDKWTAVTKAGTSVHKSNKPPYYKATEITSSVVGSATGGDTTEVIAALEADKEESSNSESVGVITDESGYDMSSPTSSSTSASQKTAEEVLGSAQTGDATASEAVTTESKDLLYSMFDSVKKKQYVFDQYIDINNLATGITLRNNETIANLDKDGWLGQKGIYYQAEVTLTFTGNGKDGMDGTQTISALSNIAGVTYSWGAEGSLEDGVPPIAQIESLSTTRAYSELKEGSIYNETFEAMAGVPSTRSLYFSTGGSEFIVSLQAEYEASKTATRTYRSLFNSTDCEYKEGDALKGLSTGQTATETFQADSNDNTVQKSVTAESNNMVEPQGDSSHNTTVNSHSSSTTIKATWTGSIANNTSEPAHTVQFDAGKPGSPCAGNGYDVGKVTVLAGGNSTTNWDVSEYNQKLQQAIDWAKQMEKISDNDLGSTWRIADSDGVQRIYHVGTAQIKITLSGGAKTHNIECGSSQSLGSINGTWTSSTAGSKSLQSNQASVLGSGFSYTLGRVGSGGGYVEGGPECSGHGSSCSGHEKPGAGEDDPPTMEFCTPHNCGYFNPAVDSTWGASNGYTFTIEVTFKDGYTTAKNLENVENVTIAKKTCGTNLPAHALCGACCMHVLPIFRTRYFHSFLMGNTKSKQKSREPPEDDSLSSCHYAVVKILKPVNTLIAFAVSLSASLKSLSSSNSRCKSSLSEAAFMDLKTARSSLPKQLKSFLSPGTKRLIL
jgi:hypothetical protein